MKLTPQYVLQAYEHGLFPMAEGRNNNKILWVDPDLRGIVPLEAVHVPRRLARTLRQNRFKISSDKAFRTVLENCATATPGRETTWINSEIVSLYCALFEMGYAHSLEAWKNGKLVGGLYGISIKGAFFGESMYSHATDSSKITLLYLVHHLKDVGYSLLDTQFLSNHLARFGGIEIPRVEYRQRLSDALDCNTEFYPLPTELDGNTVLQSITHTS